jgi:hypothetical protein|tara:strand:- start:213 stop:626 length:414 start_codon:yes stop_codon:yes gene_type:complete
MYQGVEMLKKDKAYTEKLGDIEFSQIIDGWWAPTEHELIISLLKEAVANDVIQTRHELDVAFEVISDLNDWPEGEGYGSSDRAYDYRKIVEAIERDRKFQQAENELVIINKLADYPKNDDVRKYMDMNAKIKQGLEA